MDELSKYIFNYYTHLMTEREKAAYKSIHAEEKAQNVNDTRLSHMLREKWVSSDPEVKALIADGPEAFMKSVCDRILRERPEQVYFNYCPKCGALARTPMAKQCPKCFYSWHDGA
jgi:hypothetical protein